MTFSSVDEKLYLKELKSMVIVFKKILKGDDLRENNNLGLAKNGERIKEMTEN